jgi:hypothetical protein
MRLLVGEIFDFSDLREREPFPEAPVYEKTLFWTDPPFQNVFILFLLVFKNEKEVGRKEVCAASA